MLAVGFVDAATVVIKKTDSPDLPLGSGYLCPDSTINPYSSVAHDAGVVCASVQLTKSVKDVGVPAEGNVESTEFSSDVRPLERPSGSAVPPCLYIPRRSLPSRSASRSLSLQASRLVLVRNLLQVVARASSQCFLPRPPQLSLALLSRVGLLG